MKSVLILSLIIWGLAACKKDVDELPPVTQTGANTFGARVNGQLWVPQGFGVAQTASILEARFADGGSSVVINARNFGSSPTETEFEIYLKDITASGTFLLNQFTDNYPNQSASYGYYIERRFTPLDEWITNTQFNGRIDVTRFDVTNKIISGTFEFRAAKTANASQFITVTEGRFDVKIQ